jgi:pectinesterase
MKNIFCVLGSIFLFFHELQAQRIVVAADGSGNFKSIQAAIESISSEDSSGKMREIFIKNGIYNEKLFIDKKHFLKLKGESEKGVQVIFSQARDFWRCSHPDDWGAAVINVKSHDLILENLTFINDYGFKAKGDTTITCGGESGNNTGTKEKYALPREKGEPEGTKVVRKDGHQFAFRSFPGATRIAVKNCTFRALGGDTVSPWDVENGMYYFKNCTMEGGVDFYCPRGWAWAENCRFICHNMNAAIWHDGSGGKNRKTILKNCTFEGDKGYKLGRFHRDSEFYLLNCSFDENIADADIYWVTSAPKPLEWGRRVYYFNCHHKGGDFDWHKDNLTISPKTITVNWLFEGKWNPK